MSSGRVVQGKNRGESGPAGKAVPCALVKADAGKGQGWRRLAGIGSDAGGAPHP